MNMVNDGKDIRLDTPEGVKHALLAGTKLYNPETGEFFWLWDGEESVAKVRAPLDDLRLLEALESPDFDLIESIVEGMDYPGISFDDSGIIFSPTSAQEYVFGNIASRPG